MGWREGGSKMNDTVTLAYQATSHYRTFPLSFFHSIYLP